MLARDLAERIPVVRPSDSALAAARLIASHRVSGVVVVDDSGEPEAVIGGLSLLRTVIPKYVREDPRLAHAYDEAGADELIAKLASRTVRQVMEHDGIRPTRMPEVHPDHTMVEIAAVMVREQTPVVVVRGAAGDSTGVVTLSRVMAAVLTAAGASDPRVEQTLTLDLVDASEEDGPTFGGTTGGGPADDDGTTGA